MSVTHCLLPFANRIRALPLDKWSAEVERLPEVCPNGCKVNCRTFCADYARTQWRCAKALEGRR